MTENSYLPEYFKPKDARFLLGPNGDRRQLIAVCFFAAPNVGRGQVAELIRQRIRERIAFIPRLRQRAVITPLGLAPPAWFGADAIDWDHHVRFRSVSGGGLTEFLNVLPELLGPLDLARPPWVVHVVEGFDDGRWGVVVQAHHSLGDATAGVTLLGAAMFDFELSPTNSVSEDSVLPPSNAALIRHALRWQRLRVAARCRDLALFVRTPERIKAAATRSAALLDFVLREVRNPYRPAAINSGLSGKWVVRSISRPESQLRALARSIPGATVNTVFIAAVGRALHEVLAAHGEPVAGPLKVNIPKSMRQGAEDILIHSSTQTGDMTILIPPPRQDCPAAFVSTIGHRIREAVDRDEPSLRAMLGGGGASPIGPFRCNLNMTLMRGPSVGMHCLGSGIENCMLFAVPGGSKGLGAFATVYDGIVSILVLADASLAEVADDLCAATGAWLDEILPAAIPDLI